MMHTVIITFIVFHPFICRIRFEIVYLQKYHKLNPENHVLHILWRKD